MEPLNSSKANLNNEQIDRISNKSDDCLLKDAHFPRFIKWIREPSENGWDLALKIGLTALTVITALSIVGLLVVLPGMIMVGIEWNRQMQVVQLPQVSLEDPHTDEQKKKSSDLRKGESGVTSAKTKNRKEQDQALPKAREGKNSDLSLVLYDNEDDTSEIISSDENISESVQETTSTELVFRETGRMKINEITLSKINSVQLRELLSRNGISFVTLRNQAINVNAYWKMRVPGSESEFKEPPLMLNIQSLELSGSMRKKPFKPVLEVINYNQSVKSKDHFLMNEEFSVEPQVEELSDEYQSLSSSSESSLEEDSLVKDLDEALQLFQGPLNENQDDNVDSALVVPQKALSFLNPNDETSLNNLAQIKKNQVIDVYEDDQISKPYEDVKNGYVWGTGLWLMGYGTNTDKDLVKIENLMKRCLHAYFKGCNSVEGQLKHALIGLNNLRDHYFTEGRISTSDILERIINEVEMGLNFEKKAHQPLFLLKAV